MDRYEDEGHVNVGTGSDLSIRALAELIRDIVHPDAQLVFDATKPDGMPRKLLDVSKLDRLGWRAQIELRDGVTATYEWFLEHQFEARSRELVEAVNHAV
jgi:GDP-L-fucose synthase